MTGEELARAMEAERLTPMPSSTNADERLLALFLENVEGDGTAARKRTRKAMERIVKRLQANGSVTGLFVRLLNAEATSRGWM